MILNEKKNKTFICHRLSDDSEQEGSEEKCPKPQ